MKKLWVLALTTVFALVLAGCEQFGNDDKNDHENGSDHEDGNDINYCRFTIKNSSSSELTNVTWNGLNYRHHKDHYQQVDTLSSGFDDSIADHTGSGYIFFRLWSNPLIELRTQELITVDWNEEKEFNFINNTICVEVNNSANIGTLGSYQSKVVWFDDGTGEDLPYFSRKPVVMRYLDTQDFSIISGYQGVSAARGLYNTAIAIGFYSDSSLHIKVDLNKNAKLSFWYANRSPLGVNTTDGAVFTINTVEKAKWTTDNLWSHISFDLQPGENNLIWEKKDGWGSELMSTEHYYLSLDDILIYYTE